MRTSHDGWRRVRTLEEGRAACQNCSEILFVKGPKERFDATSLTHVVKDSDLDGPYLHEPPSDPYSLCAHYLQWLFPRSEFTRPMRNDRAARIELWTNDRKLHLFEESQMTEAGRLAHQPTEDADRRSRSILRPIKTRSVRIHRVWSLKLFLGRLYRAAKQL